MRIFIGLQPSPAFRDALSALQGMLREAGVAGRWLDPSNLHMTLAFIGQWEDPEAVLSLLPAVEKPFPVVLSHIGVFQKADVLWAGTASSEALDELAERVRSRLLEAGIPFDPRPFVPHITLARKPILPDQFLLPAVPVPPAELMVRDICMYQSERGENGMVYSVIGRSPEKAEGML